MIGGCVRLEDRVVVLEYSGIRYTDGDWVAKGIRVGENAVQQAL